MVVPPPTGLLVVVGVVPGRSRQLRRILSLELKEEVMERRGNKRSTEGRTLMVLPFSLNEEFLAWKQQKIRRGPQKHCGRTSSRNALNI